MTRTLVVALYIRRCREMHYLSVRECAREECEWAGYELQSGMSTAMNLLSIDALTNRTMDGRVKTEMRWR